MKIVVVGSGLIGLTTAYFLRCRGHEVTVIERREGPGRETSFANGALLTPGMTEPWNAPGCWRVLLGSLGRSDAALQLRLRALPALAGWGVAFLRNSRTAAFERHARSNSRLAFHSLRVMQSLREQVGIEYGRAARGSLKVFRDEAALDKTYAAAKGRLAEDLSLRRLSRAETVDLEPALAPIAEQLVGAIHYRTDETGDAYRFCVALAEQARRQGVEFRFGAEVSALEMRSGRVTAVVSERERVVADRYVVAAGSYSTPLLQRVGVRLPVRPAKGYSITIDSHRSAQPLSVPVIDDHLHAVIVPLDGALRVAGTAEFAGYNLALSQTRIHNLLKFVRQILPQAQFDPATAKPWCGLRPMTTDGVPIIGTTPVANLLVNTGHGHLGWTMAAGSAQLLAELLCEETPSIDPAPFAFARFGVAR